tara:strand:+ start:1630 stop:1830 length:201 start_codon:yes stop_codon:yes gene_type:complete
MQRQLCGKYLQLRTLKERLGGKALPEQGEEMPQGRLIPARRLQVSLLAHLAVQTIFLLGQGLPPQM